MNTLFLGLGYHAWITLFVIVASFAILIRTKLPVYFVFMVGLATLTLTGCIELKSATEGFSSSTMVMLVGLYFVISALESTGFMKKVAVKMLGKPRSYNNAIVRVMLVVGALSGFLSNTAVVALFVKVVKHWANQLNIAPSKLLIPLSYASNIGGTLLLIGTPTNLIIADSYSKSTGDEVGVFFPFIAGLACLVTGIISVLAMQKLLPVRRPPEEELVGGNSNVTELVVPSDSPFVGQTIDESPLKSEFMDREELYLVGIVRFDGIVVGNVDENEFIMGGDTLLIAGNKHEIVAKGKQYGLKCNALEEEVQEEKSRRLPIAIAIMLVAILLPSFDILPVAQSFMVAAIAMVVTRCCSIKEGRSAIDGNTILTFGCSLAYGKAIENTGIAQFLADNISNLCGSNAFFALLFIGLMATFLTEFISNIACAAITVPVALGICDKLDANPLTFCLVLMISCSCSFATPTGTMPNLLVYVPGGYRFSDFLRIGVPMNIIVLIANVIVCTLLFPLH